MRTDGMNDNQRRRIVASVGLAMLLPASIASGVYAYLYHDSGGSAPAMISVGFFAIVLWLAVVGFRRQ